MPKHSLSKSIFAKKLHRRTMVPLPDQEVTIPYGAILDKVSIEPDTVTFEYLSDPFSCPRDMFLSAASGLAAKETAAAPAAPSPKPPAAPAPEPEPEPVAQEEETLQFEKLATRKGLSRAKVPGGWLILTTQGSVTFYPDAAHEWDGASSAE